MSYGSEGGRRHREGGLRGAAATQRAEHAPVQRRGGLASAPAATFMGDPVAMVRGGLRMARRELSVLENSLARLRAAVSPDGARDMDEARQRAAMAQIHLERVRRAVDSAARWLPLVPELAEELAAMRAAYDQAVGETEALRGQAPPDYRDRDRLVATAGQPGSDALFAEDEARAQGEWNDSLDERAARDRRREQAPATIDAAPSYDEDRGTIDLDAMGGSEPAVATPAPARRLDRGAEQAPVTIDAPPSYDEDRGTIDLDGVDVRERPAEAAPAPLDRRAERAAATIDAPPSYDEDRGTLDLDAMRGRDAAAAPAPAHRLDRRAEQAAVTIDAAPSYDEDRGTIDIDAMRARDVDGGAAMRDAPRVAAVQRRASDSAVAVADPHAIAAAGLTGAGGPLPHLDAIQRSFGAHDVGHVQAHVGGAAATASAALGAEAYATGDHVAFAAAPSLHTAAHEAAHVIQQQVGVQLKGGIGEAGDAYEQHADAVADAVVRGESAEALLGPVRSGAAPAAVQRKRSTGAGTDTTEASGSTRKRGSSPETVVADLTKLYGDTRKAIKALQQESDPANGTALANNVRVMFIAASSLMIRLDHMNVGDQQANVDDLKAAFEELEAKAAPLLAAHGVGGAIATPATGVPVVDHGLGCEQVANHGGSCFLDEKSRTRLLIVLDHVVGSAMDNFRDAIQNVQLDELTKKDESSWGFLAEFLFYALTGPLIGAVAKGLKGARAAAKVADVNKAWQEEVLGNVAIKPGILTRAIDAVPEEALVTVLQNASRGLRAHLKDKARSHARADVSFLRTIQGSIKMLSDDIVTKAPAQVDDAGLIALVQVYQDAETHSIASYEAGVRDLHTRFKQQGLDTINEKYKDGGRRRAVVLVAFGHKKVAILDEHGTGKTGSTYDKTSWGGGAHGDNYGDGVDKLSNLVDDDLADYARDLSDGAEKEYDVSHWADEPEHWTLQPEDGGEPFEVRSSLREKIVKWVRTIRPGE